jgi:hypothetical protein
MRGFHYENIHQICVDICFTELYLNLNEKCRKEGDIVVYLIQRSVFSTVLVLTKLSTSQ